MIQKQLRKITQILTVKLHHGAVDFKHRDLAVAVYFVAWWMSGEIRFALVPYEFVLRPEKTEGELAEIEAVHGSIGMEFFRKR
jgi:hypothetical protein